MKFTKQQPALPSKFTKKIEKPEFAKEVAFDVLFPDIKGAISEYKMVAKVWKDANMQPPYDRLHVEQLIMDCPGGRSTRGFRFRAAEARAMIEILQAWLNQLDPKKE